MSPALSVIFPLLLFNIGFLLFLSHLRYRNGLIYFPYSKNYVGCCILLCLLISVFATYDGDWWHYKEIVKDIYHHPNNITHLETVHIFIIKYLSFGDNYIWRLVTWSICLVFTTLSFKVLKINDLLTWCCYIVLFALYSFSTGRVAVAIAMQFYGYTYIITHDKSFKSIFIGCFWIIISLLFHKSAFLTIIPIFFSFLPLRKWQIILYFLAIPFAIIIFKKYLILFLIAGNASDSVVRYLDQDTAKLGLARRLMDYLFKITVFGVYILAGIRIYIQKIDVPYYINVLFKFTTFIMLEYLVVYGALTAAGIGNSAISARILPMLLLPLVIIYAYLWNNRRYSFILLFFGLISILAINYRLLYAYYLYRLGTGI